MKHLLRKGQVFRCAQFWRLCATLEHHEETGYSVNFDKLHFDSSNTTTITKKETAPGGWKRETQETLDLAIHDDNIVNQDFVVLEVKMTGGGTGHGPHDIYPDGHHVVAQEVGGKGRYVSFYQTGCFIGMVEPEEIELISGPGDTEVKYRQVLEEAW